MNKGISKIEVTTILAILVVAITTAFIFGTTRNNNTGKATPIPAYIFYTSTPAIKPVYTINPTIAPSASYSPSPSLGPAPTPSISATPTSKPSVSGVNGLATLKSCIANTCNTKTVAQMKIDIKNISNILIKAIYTNSVGKFSINLEPGEYRIGPFRESSTSALIKEGKVKVNKGYFSEVNIKFEYRE